MIRAVPVNFNLSIQGCRNYSAALAKIVQIILRCRWIAEEDVAITVIRRGLNLWQSIASKNNSTLRGRNPRKWKVDLEALPFAVRIEITISQAASSSDPVIAEGASNIWIRVVAEQKAIAVDGIFRTVYLTSPNIDISSDGPGQSRSKIKTGSTHIRTKRSYGA